MSKNVKLNSDEWRDIIFEGRNQEYGAYKLRQDSWKTHIFAMVMALLFVLLVIGIYYGADAMQEARAQRKAIATGTTTEVEIYDYEEPEQLIEDLIQEQAQIEKPPLKSSIQFTPPVIVDQLDDDAAETLTVDELLDSKKLISVANIDGDDDLEGMDIKDLLESNQQIVAAALDNTPRLVVQVMPQFPGGEAALMRWINENIQYPSVASENNIQGRVSTRFVVNRDGTISNIEILQGVHPSLDAEAIRILKNMPKWQAGSQDGVALPVYCTLPIVFRLEER